MLREPIIRVLFEHGEFVAESTALTTLCPLLLHAFGLPAFAAIKLDVLAVLLHPRYAHARTHRGLFRLALAICAERDLPALALPSCSNGGPVTSHRRRQGFPLFLALRDLPAALRPAGYARRIALAGAWRSLRRHDGKRKCEAWGLRVSGLDAHAGFLPRLGDFRRLDRRCGGDLSGAGLVTCVAVRWREIYGIAVGIAEPQAATLGGLSQELREDAATRHHRQLPELTAGRGRRAWPPIRWPRTPGTYANSKPSRRSGGWICRR